MQSIILGTVYMLLIFLDDQVYEVKNFSDFSL